MWKMILLAGLLFAIATLTGVVLIKRAKLDRWGEQMVEDLITASTHLPEQVVCPTDWAGLPAPVQRYFEHVLPQGASYSETVTIQQDGTFRDGDTPSAPWYPFTATQHVTIRPPGFVWDACIRMRPGIPVRVFDAYHDGQGVLRAVLGGAITVMNADPGPMLDEGELLRYLAEAPLYPTALLPSMGVQWTPIDDRSARATLTDRGTTVSLVFCFNDHNEVVRVRGTRGFRTEDGTYESRIWTGYWHHYESRSGYRVPTQGEVSWIHPAGEVAYWRGRISHVEYIPSGRPARPAPKYSGAQLD